MSPVRQTVPPPGDATERVVAGAFVPEQELMGFVSTGAVRRAGILLETADGRAFVLQEAVRFLGRFDGETDPFGLVGAVEPVASLLKRGFVMNSERVALGKLVYDVVFGVICHPLPTRPPQPPGTPDDSGPQPASRPRR